MKIKLLKPRECLLDEWDVGTVVEVYWDELNECWRELYKEDPAAFFEDWWDKGFFEFVEERPSNKDASKLDLIKTFTMNHKNLEISFEDGMIILRDWDVRLNQPMDYRCDTIEQLEELMGAWENLCKFKVGVER